MGMTDEEVWGAQPMTDEEVWGTGEQPGSIGIVGPFLETDVGQAIAGPVRQAAAAVAEQPRFRAAGEMITGAADVLARGYEAIPEGTGERMAETMPGVRALQDIWGAGGRMAEATGVDPRRTAAAVGLGFATGGPLGAAAAGTVDVASQAFDALADEETKARIHPVDRFLLEAAADYATTRGLASAANRTLPGLGGEVAEHYARKGAAQEVQEFLPQAPGPRGAAVEMAEEALRGEDLARTQYPGTYRSSRDVLAQPGASVTEAPPVPGVEDLEIYRDRDLLRGLRERQAGSRAALARAEARFRGTGEPTRALRAFQGDLAKSKANVDELYDAARAAMDPGYRFDPGVPTAYLESLEDADQRLLRPMVKRWQDSLEAQPTLANSEKVRGQIAARMRSDAVDDAERRLLRGYRDAIDQMQTAPPGVPGRDELMAARRARATHGEFFDDFPAALYDESGNPRGVATILGQGRKSGFKEFKRFAKTMRESSPEAYDDFRTAVLDFATMDPEIGLSGTSRQGLKKAGRYRDHIDYLLGDGATDTYVELMQRRIDVGDITRRSTGNLGTPGASVPVDEIATARAAWNGDVMAFLRLISRNRGLHRQLALADDAPELMRELIRGDRLQNNAEAYQRWARLRLRPVLIRQGLMQPLREGENE